MSLRDLLVAQTVYSQEDFHFSKSPVDFKKLSACVNSHPLLKHDYTDPSIELLDPDTCQSIYNNLFKDNTTVSQESLEPIIDRLYKTWRDQVIKEIRADETKLKELKELHAKEEAEKKRKAEDERKKEQDKLDEEEKMMPEKEKARPEEQADQAEPETERSTATTPTTTKPIATAVTSAAGPKTNAEVEKQELIPPQPEEEQEEEAVRRPQKEEIDQQTTPVKQVTPAHPEPSDESETETPRRRGRVSKRLADKRVTRSRGRPPRAKTAKKEEEEEEEENEKEENEKEENEKEKQEKEKEQREKENEEKDREDETEDQEDETNREELEEPEETNKDREAEPSFAGDSISTRRKRTRETSSTTPTSDAAAARPVRSFSSLISPLMDEIFSNKSSHMFTQPVNPKDAPDYYDVIYHPTDLKTIKAQVREGTISNLDELEREIERMFANAVIYNESDSDVTLLTREMQTQVQKMFELFRNAQKDATATNTAPVTAASSSDNPASDEESSSKRPKR